MAHGVAGGLTSSLRGGKFKDGFLGAAFVQGASPVVGMVSTAKDFMGKIARTTAAAVVGGTVSAIGGGKFANGAWSAAFARLYNDDSPAHEARSAAKLGVSLIGKLKYRFGLSGSPLTKVFGPVLGAEIGLLDVDAALGGANYLIRLGATSCLGSGQCSEMDYMDIINNIQSNPEKSLDILERRGFMGRREEE